MRLPTKNKVIKNLPRRAILLRGIASCAVAMLIAGSLEGASTPVLAGGSDERPNVLIIMTDDQRNMLKGMKQTRKIFKDRGRTFVNSYAATPNCCPSRASVFSGRYSHNHGVENNQLVQDFDHGATLQRYLQDEGYRTGIFGKFLNGWDARENPPYFDRWAIHKFHSAVYYGGRYSVDGVMKNIGRYGTDFVSDKAVNFIEDSESSDSKPWLMYVTPNAPHEPAKPEEEYEDREFEMWPGNPAVYETDRSDKLPYVSSSNVSQEAMSSFRERQLQTLLSVDDMVGRIFETMNRLNETRDTIAVFTSDNGYLWGEHGVRGKLLPYEHAVRIPLIVRAPGYLDPDSDDERLVVNIDIAPTILDAIGIQQDPDTPMDGKSLLDQSWNRSRILLEYRNQESRGVPVDIPTWKGLRTETAAYTEYYDEFGVVTFREYYDLITDPYELENLLVDDNLANDVAAEMLQAELAIVKGCQGSDCP